MMGEYDADFAALMSEEQLDDPEDFPGVTRVGLSGPGLGFDEVPIYSRDQQVSFLKMKPVESNHRLILEAVRQIDGRHEHYGGPLVPASRMLRMVAVQGWAYDDGSQWKCHDGTQALVQPYLWIGDLNHPNMGGFRVHRPRSAAADYVAAIVDQARYAVFENLDRFIENCPVRVYVVRRELLPLLPIAED